MPKRYPLDLQSAAIRNYPLLWPDAILIHSRLRVYTKKSVLARNPERIASSMLKPINSVHQWYHPHVYRVVEKGC